MAARQIAVEVPETLPQEIDEVVGSENRRSFLIEPVEAELRKRRLLCFLKSDESAWEGRKSSRAGQTGPRFGYALFARKPGDTVITDHRKDFEVDGVTLYPLA